MRRLAFTHEDTCYDGLVFLNCLLVAHVKTKRVVRTTPKYHELQPYSEAGLNVRAWRRYVSALSLQYGDRVIVRGGVEDGMVATFYTSQGLDVSIVPEQNLSSEEMKICTVSLHQLEREFKEGDTVRRISTFANEPERRGTIIKITDLDAVSQVKEKRNTSLCSAQIESLQSSSGQFGWYNRLLAKYGKDETHGLGYIENKDRQRAERFQPNSLYAALEPRRLEVLILEDDTLEEVSQLSIPILHKND